MNLSKTVTLKEATRSDTATRLGIDNTPSDEIIENMKLTGEKIVDVVRSKFEGVFIPSFFRCDALNTAVGGAPTSDHRLGRSVDLDSKDNAQNVAIFDFIRQDLTFDQCIGEYPDKEGVFSWVHASIRPKDNRGQVLVKLKTKYIPFSEWSPGMV